MIVEKNRKRIEVTEKAYRVVYASFGFKPVEDKDDNEELNYYDKTAAELKKINKDKLIAFLKQEEFEFDASATKDELISFITGEGDVDDDDNGGSQEDTTDKDNES